MCERGGEKGEEKMGLYEEAYCYMSRVKRAIVFMLIIFVHVL